MDVVAGWLIIGGCVFLVLGAMQVMFGADQVPPPGGCTFVGLLLIGMVSTKIGRIGIVCFSLGALLMSWITN